MDEVLDNRVAWGQIDAEYAATFDCYVAGHYPKEIGETVYIRPAEWKPDMDGKFTKCLVIDTAGVQDGGLAWMLRNNVLYELNADTMLRLSGRLGRGLKIVTGCGIEQIRRHNARQRRE